MLKKFDNVYRHILKEQVDDADAKTAPKSSQIEAKINHLKELNYEECDDTEYTYAKDLCFKRNLNEKGTCAFIIKFTDVDFQDHVPTDIEVKKAMIMYKEIPIFTITINQFTDDETYEIDEINQILDKEFRKIKGDFVNAWSH